MYLQPELATFPRMLVMVVLKLWCSEHHNNNTPHPAPDFRNQFSIILYTGVQLGFRIPLTVAGLYIKQSLSWNVSRSGGIEMSDGKSGAGDVNANKCASEKHAGCCQKPTGNGLFVRTRIYHSSLLSWIVVDFGRE